jgi:hypothetical protein
MAHRPGFVIPNASDGLVSFRQAEVDAGDTSILGNERYGVLYGCELNVTSLSLALGSGPHVIVADGQVYRIDAAGEQVTLNTGSSTDRFDLVGWDLDAPGLIVVAGTPTGDPKFPFIPDRFVPFAAVYVAAGATSITSGNVIDKRRLILNGARGAVDATEVFLKNINSATGSTRYEVLGNGSTRWDNNAVSLGYVDGSLTVQGSPLSALSGLSVTGELSVTGTVAATGNLTAKNFKRGSGDPTGAGVLGIPGDEYSRTDTGQKYIYRSGGIGWAEIYADEYPPGTIISSLLTGTDAETHMAGWLPLLGGTFTAAQMGRLADMGAPFSTWKNETPPGELETWTVPNLTDKGLLGGTPGAIGGSNNVTLTEANLPSHKHFSGTTTTSAGGHDHSGVTTTGNAGSHNHVVSEGAHSHAVNDPGHLHYGNHGVNSRTNFVVWFWGGKSKLDSAAGADASHTQSVEGVPWTSWEQTGITIPSGGAHTHRVSSAGDHNHSVNIGAVSGHTHSLPTESAVGSGAEVNITPAHLRVTYYVKV